MFYPKDRPFSETHPPVFTPVGAMSDSTHTVLSPAVRIDGTGPDFFGKDSRRSGTAGGHAFSFFFLPDFRLHFNFEARHLTGVMQLMIQG